MQITENQRKWCLKVINHLFKWKLAIFFKDPVDPEKDEFPDYFDIVKNPKDLETVKKTLLDGDYHNVDDFISDLHLVFDNAKLYFGKDSVMWYIAEEILQWLNKMEKFANFSAEQVWYHELTEIKEKIEKHISEMPPSFKYPTAKASK